MVYLLASLVREKLKVGVKDVIATNSVLTWVSNLHQYNQVNKFIDKLGVFRRVGLWLQSSVSSIITALLN